MITDGKQWHNCRVTLFLEERAALEDAKQREPDYSGPRGLGKYLRALVAELRDPANAAQIAKDAGRETISHRPPDFFDCHGVPRYVCECGTVEGLHEFGRHRDCEYFNHHCDSCHEHGACTAHDHELDAVDEVKRLRAYLAAIADQRSLSAGDAFDVADFSITTARNAIAGNPQQGVWPVKC